MCTASVYRECLTRTPGSSTWNRLRSLENGWDDALREASGLSRMIGITNVTTCAAHSV
ncbi:hypothetical protein E2R23_11905 [Burkholderia pseudomallei]|uniref:Uncharacterized protein n=1 Tax=Burkholderia pseudomallei TaxID=28450 RepID=A0AAX0UGY1_BURPE|nr:hypothetical protein BHT10_22180 [Burkholderia pseudomallei]MBM5624151.1 hypothetical protein [Burkholderia pseudomallei]MBM5687723.1 hypothetical protein [Burkholderia pseudomallei]MPT66669.1 hypothetical protein [Burkholderia pseudomallei]MPT68734.1 hypothetical protein [Burkholderia pseudomallei]